MNHTVNASVVYDVTGRHYWHFFCTSCQWSTDPLRDISEGIEHARSHSIPSTNQ